MVQVFWAMPSPSDREVLPSHWSVYQPKDTFCIVSEQSKGEPFQARLFLWSCEVSVCLSLAVPFKEVGSFFVFGNLSETQMNEAILLWVSSNVMLEHSIRKLVTFSVRLPIFLASMLHWSISSYDNFSTFQSNSVLLFGQDQCLLLSSVIIFYNLPSNNQRIVNRTAAWIKMKLRPLSAWLLKEGDRQLRHVSSFRNLPQHINCRGEEVQNSIKHSKHFLSAQRVVPNITKGTLPVDNQAGGNCDRSKILNY